MYASRDLFGIFFFAIMRVVARKGNFVIARGYNKSGAEKLQNYLTNRVEL